MYSSFTRRRFLARSGQITLAGALAGPLLAACGGSQNPSTNNGAQIVNYWIGLDEANARKYLMEHDIDVFNKQHPNIEIKVSFKPLSDVDRLIQIALPAGKGPDIVPSPGPSYALQYINGDLLTPLDQYAEKYKWKDTVSAWALDAGRIKGKLYSLPTSYEAMILYYNKGLFDQKGWKAPTNRSEFEALAEEAMGNGITPFMAGNADWRPATEWFTTIFLNHYAGPDAVYQALTGQVPWTDPVFVEAVELMKTYFQKGWFGGGVKQYFTNAFPPQRTNFAKGKAAMDMEGSWAFYNWPEFFDKKVSDMDYDWAPIPPLRDGLPQNIFALATGSTLSISAKSKVQDAAIEYINWLFSTPQRVTQGMADMNFAPLPIPLKEADFPAHIDQRYKDHYLKLNEATSQGVFGYATWTFWPPKSDVVTYEAMDKVLTNDITAAEFCTQLNDTFKKELAEGVVPPTPKGNV